MIYFPPTTAFPTFQTKILKFQKKKNQGENCHKVIYFVQKFPVAEKHVEKPIVHNSELIYFK
jgi:hypothetical protein